MLVKISKLYVYLVFGAVYNAAYELFCVAF